MMGCSLYHSTARWGYVKGGMKKREVFLVGDVRGAALRKLVKHIMDNMSFPSSNLVGTVGTVSGTVYLLFMCHIIIDSLVSTVTSCCFKMKCSDHPLHPRVPYILYTTIHRIAYFEEIIFALWSIEQFWVSMRKWCGG